MFVIYCSSCGREMKRKNNKDMVMCRCNEWVDMRNSVNKERWNSLSEFKRQSVSGYKINGILGFLKWMYGEMIR